MVAGYTRQAAANIQPGLRANAEDCNAEWNQLATAFDNTAGHDHSGSVAGDGVKIPLGSAVTGVLPIANGGTGSATATMATLTVNPGGVLVGTAGVVPGTGSLTLNANTVAPAAGSFSTPFGAIGADNANCIANVDSYGTGGSSAYSTRHARGTAAAPTAVQSGDFFGSFSAAGYDGAGFSPFGFNGFRIGAIENWTTTAHGSKIDFLTVASGTTTPPITSLTLQGNTATFSGTVSTGGNININQGAADSVLTLQSTAQIYQIINQQSTGSFIIQDFSVPAIRLNITSAGVCSASSAWGVISDATLKTEIADHPHGLAEILRLQPKTFRYAEDDRAGSGLIAQELEAVMPELVGEAPTPDGGTVKTVTETGIIWPLVNACKELAAQNAALVERLAALEAKLGT